MADERPKLPVIGGVFAKLSRPSGPPTLEQARETLGGPWVGDGTGTCPVGSTVAVQPVGTHGVVVHAEPDRRDVWIGGGRIQRVSLDRIEPKDAPEWAQLADEARVFLHLRPSAPVAYETRTGEVGEGVLIEKLRYGGLVGLEDGRVVAVSFRKLTPLEPPSV
ncbi:MAG: hypothetical protein AB8I08_22325 [Sandaracinaceae bacterium]